MTAPASGGSRSWFFVLLAALLAGALWFWKGGSLSDLVAMGSSGEPSRTAAQAPGPGDSGPLRAAAQQPSPQDPGPRQAGRESRPASSAAGATRKTESQRMLGYAPASRDPGDAVPGGGLKAHEGLEGSHTLSRHVGKTLDFLKKRAADEGKRRVSTFKDLATADAAVAEVLYQNQTAIRKWLAGRPVGNQDFDAQLRASPGTVWLADKERSVAGRTVVVVLAASRRFPEGFRIVTAYVDTP